MSSTYRLIFRGEILPGHQHEAVQQRVIALFKASPEQCAQLFSGQPVVVRKGISEADLDKYQTALTKAGLKIYTESEGGLPPLSLLDDDPEPAPVITPPPPTPAAPAPAAPSGEQITCPKCGHTQPKRTLCLKCSADMPALLRAQQQIQEEPLRAHDNNVHYAQTTAPTSSRPPAIFGFGFKGRWGRLSWLNANLLKTVLSLLFLAILMSIGGAAFLQLSVLLLLSSPLYLYWAFRDSALRCHDLGWSGFWSLLYLVPIVNILFPLALLFLPGDAETNEYDAPPQSDNWLVTIGALVLIVILSWSSVSKLVRLMQMSEMVTAQSTVRPAVAANGVIMYSISDCAICDQKRAELQAGNIPVTEYFLDEDKEAEQEFKRLLLQSNRPSRIEMPALVVNGVLMTNNPSVEQIRAQLR